MTNKSKDKNSIINKLKNYHPPKSLTFLYLFIPLFNALRLALTLDNDFWFLTNTGKYIINNGFPTIEPFTIHKNFDFIIQQWLTDVIFYYIHQYLGGWGIVFLTMILFIIILFITYKLCLLVSENRFNLSIILTVIIGTLLSMIYVRSRPQMFDYIILLLLLYQLELYIRKKDKKYLYPLPLLSLLLINLHSSSWLMLFAFILPYLINSYKFTFLCFESEGYPRKPLFITVFLMIVIAFINPYGIKAMTYIFTSYGNSYINNIVSEMKSPLINTSSGLLVYLIIFLVYFCYIISKKDKIKIRYFLLLLGTTFLSLQSIKGFSFFIIGAIFSLGDHFKENFQVYKEKYYYSKQFKIKYILILLIMTAGLVINIKSENHDFYNTNISKTIKYLEKVEKIDKKNSKIYTSYDNGSFAEYKGLKVYLDPRAEVFVKKNNHKEDIIKEYYKLQMGQIDITKFLQKYQFDYLIINTNDYMYKYYLDTTKNKLYEKIYNENEKGEKHYLYKKVAKNDN